MSMNEANVELSKQGADSPAAPRLRKELARETRRWQLGTINYGITYYLSRIVLIVASATVAANQNLSGSAGAWLIHWTPVLSLLVAVVTALDTWLKPLQKRRGFMESRDKLTDIVMRFEETGDADATRDALKELRDQHRSSNIF
ncbi:hypothetical protein ACFXHA_28995 [Nocardia sp. NPDC059240]|uniref:hypothetical protein n=1 Tax=Nocardia sp. NPDC059240 TaxID=3346786 RepID=UPI00368C3D1C